MKFPDNEATRLTEVVMGVLRWADVLQPDKPDHPANYNRAYSAIHKALTQALPADADYSSAPMRVSGIDTCTGGDRKNGPLMTSGPVESDPWFGCHNGL